MLTRVSPQLDIYHDEPIPRATKAVIYTQHEYGAASHVAMSSILQDSEPIGHIFTPLMAEQVFNVLPDFDEVGWEMYHQDDTLFISITAWPNTPMFPPEQASASWIYVYPTVRDVLSYLQTQGVSEVIYATASSIHDLMVDSFDQLQSTRIYEWRWNEMKGTRKQLFLSPPAYLFGFFADKLGMTSTLATTGYDNSEKVDIKGARSIAKYIANFTGGTVSQTAMTKTCKKVTMLHERAENLMGEVSEVLSSAGNDKQPNQMLWG